MRVPRRKGGSSWLDSASTYRDHQRERRQQLAASRPTAASAPKLSLAARLAGLILLGGSPLPAEAARPKKA